MALKLTKVAFALWTLLWVGFWFYGCYTTVMEVTDGNPDALTGGHTLGLMMMAAVMFAVWAAGALALYFFRKIVLD